MQSDDQIKALKERVAALELILIATISADIVNRATDLESASYALKRKADFWRDLGKAAGGADGIEGLEAQIDRLAPLLKLFGEEAFRDAQKKPE